MVTAASRHSPPPLPILWKEICKRHLHGFAVTHKCPGSANTAFPPRPPDEDSGSPNPPLLYRGKRRDGTWPQQARIWPGWGLGCLRPTPEARAVQRTPNPPRFRLCPSPGASEGTQALTYPLPELVPAGTSALQSGALHLPMFCCTKPEAQTAPLWPLRLLRVHPTQLPWWGSATSPLEGSACCQPAPKGARSPTSCRQGWPRRDFIGASVYRMIMLLLWVFRHFQAYCGL